MLATLDDDLAPYERSKGSLKFAVDKPLPKRLVKKLVIARMRELGGVNVIDMAADPRTINPIALEPAALEWCPEPRPLRIPRPLR